jgi:hypothetical protein
VPGKRKCRFFTDDKGRVEKYWFCATHHARVSDPSGPCYSSKYDNTPLQVCSGWSYDGCPREPHCHANFTTAATLCPDCRQIHRHSPDVPVEKVCPGKGADSGRRKPRQKNSD